MGLEDFGKAVVSVGEYGQGIGERGLRIGGRLLSLAEGGLSFLDTLLQNPGLALAAILVGIVVIKKL